MASSLQHITILCHYLQLQSRLVKFLVLDWPGKVLWLDAIVQTCIYAHGKKYSSMKFPTYMFKHTQLSVLWLLIEIPDFWTMLELLWGMLLYDIAAFIMTSYCCSSTASCSATITCLDHLLVRDLWPMYSNEENLYSSMLRQITWVFFDRHFWFTHPISSLQWTSSFRDWRGCHWK